MSSPKFSLKSKLETEVVEGGTGTTITPATSVSAETSYGGSSDVGTSEDYARADHKHGNPSNPVTSHESTYNHTNYNSHLSASAPHSGHVQVGGDIGGSASSPTVTGIHSGATALAISTITDGEYLKRVGTNIVSAAASGTVPDADASTKGKVQLAGDLSGTAASPTVVGIHSGATALSVSTIADGEFLKRSGTTIISAAATVGAHAASHGFGQSDAVSITKAQVSDFPTTMAPTAHTHANADITNATATPGASKIPIADGSGKLDGWITAPSIPSASSSVTSETSFGASSNAGSASTFSKGDHTHGTPANPVTGHESTYSHSGYDSHVAAAAPHSGHAASSHTHTAANITDATATATASKIPIADGSAKLDTWISDTGASTKGKVQLAGDLSGTAASPTVVGIHSGVTALAISTIADGEFLKRSGTNIISAAASGTTLTATVTAGENLAQYDSVYCKTSDGKYYKATNAGTIEQSQVIGIITSGAISANATGTITKIGAITNGSWSLTAGAPCWLSTAGGITQTEPITEDTYWVPLGYAETTTSIFLNPQTGILIKSFALPDVVHGKLSLVSATSIKWAFVQSNQIRLYNGSAWELVKLSAEPTLANNATDLNGTALAISKIYDVFMNYDGVDSASLKVSRWAVSTGGSSTRNAAYAAGTAYAIGDRVTSGGKDYTCIQAGTGQTPSSSPTYWCDNGTSVSGDFAGLYKQDGVLVSHNSTTGKKLRWLGTIYTFNNSTVVNFKDDFNNRLVSNYYNREPKDLIAYNSTASWTYATNAWRVTNGGTGMQSCKILSCTTTPYQLLSQARWTIVTSNCNIGYGIQISGNIAITGQLTLTTAMNEVITNCYVPGSVSAGYNYIETIEASWNSVSVTSYGSNSGSMCRGQMLF